MEILAGTLGNTGEIKKKCGIASFHREECSPTFQMVLSSGTLAKKKLSSGLHTTFLHSDSKKEEQVEYSLAFEQTWQMRKSGAQIFNSTVANPTGMPQIQRVTLIVKMSKIILIGRRNNDLE